MKTRRILRGALSLASLASITVATLLSVTGCDNKDYSKDSPFDNVVYIDASVQKDVANFTFNQTIETEKKEVTAVLARPTDADISVSFKVEPSLVSTYNARLGAKYTLLDAKHYKLTAPQAVIPKGEISSKPITIDFLSLTDLDIDTGYLLPVTIDQASNGMGILGGSKTICYVVRRSSAITSAVSLKGNYFTVPGFQFGSPTAEKMNELKQMTFEAIIRVNKFEYDISTIMGIEQYCLLRLGDAGFPRQQVQFAGPGDVKIPNPDNNKLLQIGEWYHIAVAYDTERKIATIYLDGKEQSRIEDYGNGAPVNLGMQKPGDFMFKIGHSYGEVDDMSRQLDGEICEVRIWNVIRSQEEIYQNMYNVEPTTPGLCAYWKFNEGKGDIIEDYTSNGNDAIAYDKKVVWPSGVEVTQKNKE